MSRGRRNAKKREGIFSLLKETTRRIELMDKDDMVVNLLYAVLASYSSKRETYMLDYLGPYIKAEIIRIQKLNDLGEEGRDMGDGTQLE